MVVTAVSATDWFSASTMMARASVDSATAVWVILTPLNLGVKMAGLQLADWL
jgi:hypothetical protein